MHLILSNHRKPSKSTEAQCKGHGRKAKIWFLISVILKNIGSKGKNNGRGHIIKWKIFRKGKKQKLLIRITYPLWFSTPPPCPCTSFKKTGQYQVRERSPLFQLLNCIDFLIIKHKTTIFALFLSFLGRRKKRPSVKRLWRTKGMSCPNKFSLLFIIILVNSWFSFQTSMMWNCWFCDLISIVLDSLQCTIFPSACFRHYIHAVSKHILSGRLNDCN